MSLSGFTRLSDINRMLKKCAPGSSIRLAKHRRVVDHNGRTAYLEKGDHKADPSIRLRSVWQVVLQLDLDRGCVERLVPALAGTFE